MEVSVVNAIATAMHKCFVPHFSLRCTPVAAVVRLLLLQTFGIKSDMLGLLPGNEGSQNNTLSARQRGDRLQLPYPPAVVKVTSALC